MRHHHKNRQAAHMGDSPRHMKELTRDEAIRRLAGVQVGRVFFTSHAMPAVRPVNHLIDDGQLIIRSREGSAIVTAADADRGVVVAYEADQLDPATRTGWSVVVTGLAHVVDDPREADRYRDAVQPWVAGQMDSVIRINPEIVTGFELVADQPPTST
jgi:nitroimidazol reductase NimA-like FMN-containing flavoprotein (pyridoxamine 5'-phosphate oxidase superfamily)